jgi:hypothetical protein
MFVPHGVKKIANAAEKQIGNAATQAVDAKNFVFSIKRRTISSTSTATTKSTSTHTSSTTTTATTTTKDTNHKSISNSSLMANTLLWAHLIPPMPVIASTMYRHYAKGNTNIYLIT